MHGNSYKINKKNSSILGKQFLYNIDFKKEIQYVNDPKYVESKAFIHPHSKTRDKNTLNKDPF